MSLWTIGEGTEIRTEIDGAAFKWTLRRDGHRPLFTVVEISAHMLGGCYDEGRPTARAHAAVESLGRSEVERYLDMETPPRKIGVATVGEPWIVASRGNPPPADRIT